MRMTVVEVFIIICIVALLVLLVFSAKLGLDEAPTTKIDGCEYIVFGYGDARSITHKGNCSNPIHYKTTNVE